MSSADELPDYAPMLSAYHDAHATELREMVASLPIHEGSRVLEIACGDGVYSRWIAERVGGTGEVVGVDILPAYLEVARRGAMREASRHRIRFVAADIARLPFPDDTFDLVWCAQSLYSLPDPVDALRRMTRVVRAGGEVAVLENDSFHHVLLPWPVEVELAIRARSCSASWRSRTSRGSITWGGNSARSSAPRGCASAGDGRGPPTVRPLSNVENGPSSKNTWATSGSGPSRTSSPPCGRSSSGWSTPTRRITCSTGPTCR